MEADRQADVSGMPAPELPGLKMREESGRPDGVNTA